MKRLLRTINLKATWTKDLNILGKRVYRVSKWTCGELNKKDDGRVELIKNTKVGRPSKLCFDCSFCGKEL